MADHEGPDHGDIMLTLVIPQADSGLLHQSWNICECSLPWLRGQLGDPHQESLATAEQVRATAEAVMRVPGVVHRLAGGEN
jgi:hypothetical protein